MKTIRKTKIIATLGPSSTTIPIIEDMLRAGMNVARFNFSHGTHEEHKEKINNLREASKNTGLPVALLLDTKGPQIRTGEVGGDGTLHLVVNEKIIITTDEVIGTKEKLSVNYKNLPAEISKGNNILIADGLVELEVEQVQGNNIHCIVRNGGSFRSYKNVGIPGISLSIPAITESDYRDIKFAIEEDMDFIALSFVQSAHDVEQLQTILDEANSKIQVIAKIETKKALHNISSICQTAYGTMVARGDLGIQIRPEEVPIAQKRIIRICNTLGKIVITATQMLESMVSNARPTRAEASDVANAIFDGSDAVMLSGETASGENPILAVKMMHTIALDIENSLEFRESPKHTISSAHSVGSAVAKTTYQLAKETSASVIITPTLRGNTPVVISTFRPRAPIAAISPSEIVCRQLLMCWGVFPYVSEYRLDYELLIENSINIIKEQKLVQSGDKVISIAGLPLDSPAILNSIRVHFIGVILYRASGGIGSTAHGPVKRINRLEEAYKVISENSEAILLVDRISSHWEDVLHKTRGIICRKQIRNLPEIKTKFKNLVLICGIHSKLSSLKDDQIVYISGKDNIVYESD